MQNIVYMILNFLSCFLFDEQTEEDYDDQEVYLNPYLTNEDIHEYNRRKYRRYYGYSDPFRD